MVNMGFCGHIWINDYLYCNICIIKMTKTQELYIFYKKGHITKAGLELALSEIENEKEKV